MLRDYRMDRMRLRSAQPSTLIFSNCGQPISPAPTEVVGDGLWTHMGQHVLPILDRLFVHGNVSVGEVLEELTELGTLAALVDGVFLQDLVVEGVRGLVRRRHRFLQLRNVTRQCQPGACVPDRAQRPTSLILPSSRWILASRLPSTSPPRKLSIFSLR